jgi:hypothetical protein
MWLQVDCFRHRSVVGLNPLVILGDLQGNSQRES